jgi:glutathione S-transferase
MGYGGGVSAPILYSFRRCPFAMRARLALVASGVSVELREVVLRDKPAAMVAASPKATVPVLVLADGSVIDQSLDIMHWAFATGEPAGMVRKHDAELVAANDGPFKHHLDRYKYAADMDARAAATVFLVRLDECLKGRANLDGDMPTLTDIAILPFVRQFAETDRRYFDALPLPHLQRWLARFLASPAFVRTMVRHLPWRPDDPPILFPA